MTAPKSAKFPWLRPILRQRVKLPYGFLRRRAARRKVSPAALKRAAVKGARTRLERHGPDYFAMLGRLGGTASARLMTLEDRSARALKAAQTRIKNHGADVHVVLGRKAARARWGARG